MESLDVVPYIASMEVEPLCIPCSVAERAAASAVESTFCTAPCCGEDRKSDHHGKSCDLDEQPVNRNEKSAQRLKLGRRYAWASQRPVANSGFRKGPFRGSRAGA